MIVRCGDENVFVRRLSFLSHRIPQVLDHLGRCIDQVERDDRGTRLFIRQQQDSRAKRVANAIRRADMTDDRRVGRWCDLDLRDTGSQVGFDPELKSVLRPR